MTVQLFKRDIPAASGATTTAQENLQITPHGILLWVSAFPLVSGPLQVTMSFGDATYNFQTVIAAGWTRLDPNGQGEPIFWTPGEGFPTATTSGQPFIGVRIRNDTGTADAIRLQYAQVVQ